MIPGKLYYLMLILNILKARLKKIPQRRMGDPEEIGPLVAYLVSPVSSFVTGSCFVIDGGEVSKL